MVRLLGLVLFVFAAGLACPGSTPMDPCVGVTCGPGRVCRGGSCHAAQGCGVGPACALGQRCENGLCVADQPDAGHRDAPGWPPPEGGLPTGYDSAPADGGESGARRRDGRGLDVGPIDGRPPQDLRADLSGGRWYQADRANCPTFCAGKALSNVSSPEGARCASGEVRPASAITAGIRFSEGCWGGCGAQGNTAGAQCFGPFCYRPGQKKDADKTDLTVGCFCR